MAGRDTSPDVVRESGYAGTGYITASGANTFTAGPQTFSDGVNLAFGTTTGSMIGTASTQLLGFFGATPVPQIDGATGVVAGLVTLGLRGATNNPPLNIGTGAITAGASTFSGALTLSSATIVTATNNGNSVINQTGTGGGFDFQFAGTSRITVTNTQTTFKHDISISTRNIATDTTTGSQIGTSTGQKLGFHGSAAVIQRAGAAQAAVATTSASNVTPFGYTTAAQADAIVTLVNEIRAALVEKGLIKGSA